MISYFNNQKISFLLFCIGVFIVCSFVAHAATWHFLLLHNFHLNELAGVYDSIVSGQAQWKCWQNRVFAAFAYDFLSSIYDDKLVGLASLSFISFFLIAFTSFFFSFMQKKSAFLSLFFALSIVSIVLLFNNCWYLLWCNFELVLGMVFLIILISPASKNMKLFLISVNFIAFAFVTERFFVYSALIGFWALLEKDWKAFVLNVIVFAICVSIVMYLRNTLFIPAVDHEGLPQAFGGTIVEMFGPGFIPRLENLFQGVFSTVLFKPLYPLFGNSHYSDWCQWQSALVIVLTITFFNFALFKKTKNTLVKAAVLTIPVYLGFFFVFSAISEPDKFILLFPLEALIVYEACKLKSLNNAK